MTIRLDRFPGGYAPVMSDDRTELSNEPNEEGFGGDPTTPEPHREPDVPEGEDVAVPAGDLTQATTDALEPGRND